MGLRSNETYDVEMLELLFNARASNAHEIASIMFTGGFCAPFAGVAGHIVRVVFDIAASFGLDSEIRYLAVHLLDKFLSLKYRGTSDNAEDVIDRLISLPKSDPKEVLCAIVSCLLIAHKVVGGGVDLYPSKLLQILAVVLPGFSPSRPDIVAMESEVLCTIGYSIPINPPVPVLEILISLHRSPSSFREDCMEIMEVAYIRHDLLFEALHLRLRGCDYQRHRPECADFLEWELHSGLVAAAVFLRCEWETRSCGVTADRLSTLVVAPVIFIDQAARVLELLTE